MKLNEKLTNVDYSNDHVVSDANTATETGGYYTNSDTANLPVSGSAGYLNVMYRNDDNITQVWTRYRDNQVFMRQKNTIEPSGWKEWSAIMTEPTVLYENETGTNSNFSLNDDVNNYKYIEIYTKQNNYTLAYKCQKIYNPNGKNSAIDYLYHMNDKLYGNGVQITFSGKNATLSGGFGYTVGAGGQYATASNTINIVRVIGYK